MVIVEPGETFDVVLKYFKYALVGFFGSPVSET
jgi:hypothetical protein